MRGSCVASHAFGTTDEVQIIECYGLAWLRKSRSCIETMYDGACYSFKLFGGRRAHYPGCGDEWKTGEELETTRHGPKIHNTPRQCGHILSNFSLPAASSMVIEQSGRGQKLKSGHGAHSYIAPLPTEVRHCLTGNRRNRTIFRGPNSNSNPFASGDLHILRTFPIWHPGKG